jgi:predicted NAD/FAD-dependent oxidoreductase
MPCWTVAIIGGGPGGLMLAYLLQKQANAPLAVTLYEASGRLGGKILTRQFASAPVLYEAGAAELYDYSDVGEDPLRELVEELSLPTQPMGGSAVVLDDRILASADDLREALGAPAWQSLTQFDRAARDWMGPRDYYGSDWRGAAADPYLQPGFDNVLADLPATARRYVQTLVHSDVATEPERTNGSYGLQNYLMNDPAYLRLYTIDGGIERLPRELARRLAADVRLGETVTRVGRGADGRLSVNSRRANGSRDCSFDFVVAALPHSALASVEWAGDDLAAAMRRHRAHYDYPAHYLRVSALFQRPFWRGLLNESYCMLDAFGGCCLYDESARSAADAHPFGALGWLLGGEPARQLAARPDAELVELCLDALPPPLQPGRKYLLEGCVHRWLGAVNGLPGGRPAADLDGRHRPEPRRHPDFIIVGDYLFDSTLNGVLDSAAHVADWLTAEVAAR